MDTFTIAPRSGWLLRLLGRHPLVRGSDRLEAIIVLLVTTAVILVVPLAAAVGTSVHDSRATLYSQQMATKHEVSAIVTADSTRIVEPPAGALTPLRWTTGGVLHTDVMRTHDTLKPGERMSIWVDDHGTRVPPPAGPRQAVVDAVCVAVSIWLSAIAAAVALLVAVRVGLNRHRQAAWERELDDLAADGGSRSDR